MPATHRVLVVQDHSCACCGNKWTHSFSILTDAYFGYYGGTPIGDENNLPLLTVVPRRSTPQTNCFRCGLSHIQPPTTLPEPARGHRPPSDLKLPSDPKPLSTEEPDDLLDL